ncbi:MAG: M1 family aminopeptidase, partial [Verrucomicrobiota bacterium]
MRACIVAFLILSIVSAAVAGNDCRFCGWETCASKRWSLRTKLEQFQKPRGNGKQYAPDRLVDVTHQLIEITPDFADRSLEGVSTITFRPVGAALEELPLDGFDLTVSKVESNRGITSWDYDDRHIKVLFKEPVPVGEEVTVTVNYSATPEDGLFFRTEAMGYPKGDDHLWTQGEPERHQYWFPGYDYPNERFTTEVICHVPEGMTVLSNGDLVGQKTVDGVSTFHWHQQQEHVNYLVSVVAGYFQSIKAKYGELDLAFYTTPSNFDEAENSFADTAKILEFFEKEIGVDYPWAKYYNVCVADFIAGGMENTSLTTLYDGTLFTKATENLRSTHRLDAHEVAHQWFGDLVTCKDWSHLWL